MTEDHSDAIEAVLERHGLALALEDDDGVRLVGALSDDERHAWDARLLARAKRRRRDRRRRCDMGCDVDAAEQCSTTLCRRRLDDARRRRFVAVGNEP